MYGMMGWSGTFNLPFEMVIFSPPAGTCTWTGFASDIHRSCKFSRNASMRDRRPALRTLTSTPARDGFRMPAEFERHSGCWMLWPERPDNWRSGAKPAQAAFAAVATAIAGGEPGTVGDSAAQSQNPPAPFPPPIRTAPIPPTHPSDPDPRPTFAI